MYEDLFTKKKNNFLLGQSEFMEFRWNIIIPLPLLTMFVKPICFLRKCVKNEEFGFYT